MTTLKAEGIGYNLIFFFVESTPTTRSKQQRYNKDDDAFISATDMILFYLYNFQTLLFAFWNKIYIKPVSWQQLLIFKHIHKIYLSYECAQKAS